MPEVTLTSDAELERAVAVIDAWIARWLDDGTFLVAGERQDVVDRTASHRWYLRFKGEEKDFITIWLTMRQRTLHHEAQFMPAPEAHVEAVLSYLMRRNAELFAMAFCYGPEDAIYVLGKVPAHQLDEAEMDRICGSSVAYVDDHYPTAMTMAYPELYKRRRRR